MSIKRIATSVGAYGTATFLGVYLASNNGGTVTAALVVLSLFATMMARRDHRHISAPGVLPAADERARPARIRTYEVTHDEDGRIPFHLSDADLFSRAS
jgi:hypothetical protein